MLNVLQTAQVATMLNVRFAVASVYDVAHYFTTPLLLALLPA
jgi:hypothetical protein